MLHQRTPGCSPRAARNVGIWVWAVLSEAAGCAAEPGEAKDLNPVALEEAPSHEPIVLVENGQPKATICVMEKPASPHVPVGQALKQRKAKR